MLRKIQSIFNKLRIGLKPSNEVSPPAPKLDDNFSANLKPPVTLGANHHPAKLLPLDINIQLLYDFIKSNPIYLDIQKIIYYQIEKVKNDIVFLNLPYKDIINKQGQIDGLRYLLNAFNEIYKTEETKANVAKAEQEAVAKAKNRNESLDQVERDLLGVANDGGDGL